MGGSEGLRRLRELRLDGYIILQRRHPDPERDIWQYMLTDEAPVNPIRPEPVVPGQEAIFEEIPEISVNVSRSKQIVFGQNHICDYCNGRGIRRGIACPVCNSRGWV